MTARRYDLDWLRITAFGILICLITSFKATMANGLPDSDDKFHAAASK